MAKDLIALARARRGLPPHPGTGAATDTDDSVDLSKLTKAELVERAEQAGIDVDGKTKAELVDELEGGN